MADPRARISRILADNPEHNRVDEHQAVLDEIVSTISDPAPLADVLAQAMHDLADGWDREATRRGPIKGHTTAARRLRIRAAQLKEQAAELRATVDRVVDPDP